MTVRSICVTASLLTLLAACCCAAAPAARRAVTPPPPPVLLPPPPGARPVQQFRLSDAMLDRAKARSDALAGVEAVTIHRYLARGERRGGRHQSPRVLDHYRVGLEARGWYPVMEQTEGARGAAYSSPDGTDLLAIAVRQDGFTVCRVKGKVALESIPELERLLVRSLGADKDVLPPAARLSLDRARTLESSGALDEAADALRKAISEAPRVVPLRVALADVYRKQGKAAERAAELKTVVAMDPTGYESRLNYARSLYDLRMYKEAVFEFTQASALAPDRGTPSYFIGRIHEDQGNVPLAVDAYKKAAALAPHWFSVQLRLGALHERSGEKQKATDAYRRALEIQPSSTEARQGLERVADSNK